MPRSPYTVPFDYVTNAVDRELPEVQRRVAGLKSAFDARIPPSSSDRMRMVALADILDTPVLLYVLGYNGPAILELHAWLERFVLVQIPRRLCREPVAQREVQLLLARKTLGECAEIVQRMGIWTKEDVAFVRRLKKLRDGLSHKNSEQISRALGVAKNTSDADLDSYVARIDFVELLLDAMDLMQKMKVRRRPGGATSSAQTSFE